MQIQLILFWIVLGNKQWLLLLYGSVFMFLDYWCIYALIPNYVSWMLLCWQVICFQIINGMHTYISDSGRIIWMHGWEQLYFCCKDFCSGYAIILDMVDHKLLVSVQWTVHFGWSYLYLIYLWYECRKRRLPKQLGIPMFIVFVSTYVVDPNNISAQMFDPQNIKQLDSQVQWTYKERL
jgi:hypothetical protein